MTVTIKLANEQGETKVSCELTLKAELENPLIGAVKKLHEHCFPIEEAPVAAEEGEDLFPRSPKCQEQKHSECLQEGDACKCFCHEECPF